MLLNGNGTNHANPLKNGDGIEQEHARDPRDEAPATPPSSTSRSVSPMTAGPTVDFDGLSWPSE